MNEQERFEFELNMAIFEKGLDKITYNDILYYDLKKIQEIDKFTGKSLSNALSILESNIILQHYTAKVNISNKDKNNNLSTEEIKNYFKNLSNSINTNKYLKDNKNNYER